MKQPYQQAKQGRTRFIDVEDEEEDEKKTGKSAARKKMQDMASLNIDLMETVVRIVDYESIKELEPIRIVEVKTRRQFKCSVRRRKRPKVAEEEEEEEEDEKEEAASVESFTFRPWKGMPHFEVDERGAKLREAKTIGTDQKKGTYTGDINQDFEITFYEEDMRRPELTFSTRSEIRSAVGANVLQRTMAFARAILKHGTTTYSMKRFTKIQFAVMLILYEYNPMQVQQLGRNFRTYGPLPTLMAHTTFLIILEMAFLMKMMTMANYSHTFAINFFASVPLFRGVGIVCLVLYILTHGEVARNGESALSVMLYLISNTVEWKDCPMVLDEDEVCIPFNNTIDHRSTCKLGVEMYATQYFINNVIFSTEKWDLAWYYRYSSITIWLIVLGIAIHGIMKLIRLLSQILICAFIPPVLIFSTLLAYRAYRIFSGNALYSPLRFEKETLFTLSYVTDMICLSMKMHQIPFLIWLSTMKPEKPTSEIFAVIVICFVIICSWCHAYIYSCTMDIVAETYQLDNHCIYIRTRDHIFSMVPDVLQHAPFSKVWLFLWFLFVLYLYILLLIIGVCVIVDTLVQCFPALVDVSMVTCIVVWAFMCLWRFLYFYPYINGIVDYFSWANLTDINVFLFGVFAIAVQFFYGEQRFYDDCIFYARKRPGPFWAMCWNIIAYVGMVSILLTIANIHFHFSEVKTDDVIKVYVDLIVIINSAIFVLAMFMIRTCRFLFRRRVADSYLPESRWGSPDSKLMLLRKYFFSNRDYRARRTRLWCDHKCFYQVLEYSKLCYVQQIKLKRFRPTQQQNKERKRALSITPSSFSGGRAKVVG